MIGTKEEVTKDNTILQEIDLPISSIMRSKYLEYKEYHTSLDKIDKVVTAKGLKKVLVWL